MNFLCKTRSFHHASLVVVVAWLLTGCFAQIEHDQQGIRGNGSDPVFVAGYQNIYDKYIEPVDMGEVALNGLKTISDIDPDLNVSRAEGKVRLVNGNATVRELASPDATDVDGWASVTAEIITAGRRVSKPLNSKDNEDVYTTVFRGALKGLDGHSRYASADSARQNRAMRDGFGGIGIRLRFGDGQVKVVSVMEDTPAEEAGLKANDIITEIDGLSTEGLSQEEVVARLRGPVESQVQVAVVRKGLANALSMSITRAHIVVPTVRYVRKGSIAHIQVASFNHNTAHSVVHAIEQTREEIGADLKGIVLDLRNNPGGLLDQAVAVADAFLAEGRIVSTRGRHPDSMQVFDAGGNDLAAGIPLVVLINGHSASAAEVVAAALQDHRRAILIGSNSFGKGTVQNITRLPNDGEIILTWSRLYTPSGYALHNLGVLPTICTSGDQISVSGLIERLRQGRLRITAAVRAAWRTGSGIKDKRLDKLRESCQANEESTELDYLLAKRILENRQLYVRALKLTETAEARP